MQRIIPFIDLEVRRTKENIGSYPDLRKIQG